MFEDQTMNLALSEHKKGCTWQCPEVWLHFLGRWEPLGFLSPD